MTPETRSCPTCKKTIYIYAAKCPFCKAQAPDSSPKTKRTPTENYASEISKQIQAGWQISSDGPSGIQFKKPKKFSNFSVAWLAAGALACLASPIIGIVLMLISILNYAITKEKTNFIPKPQFDQ